MEALDPRDYGPVFERFLCIERAPSIGPDGRNEYIRRQLDTLTVRTAFENRRVTDPHMAISCVAAVWLYHGFLREAYDYLEKVPTPSGAYWHGIMHRCEPDPERARERFAQVDGHPCYPELQREAARLAAAQNVGPKAEFLITQTEWSPERFIDLVMEVHGGDERYRQLCEDVHDAEFAILFDHCHENAANPVQRVARRPSVTESALAWVQY